MVEKHRHDEVRSRNEPFVARTATRICREIPSETHPYIAQRMLCHGYDLFELMDSCSWIDMLYLLFRGELPSADEAQLLQGLSLALMNPGPRHPATRAAMNAGVGKTRPGHILPIASALLAGDYQGGGEIEEAMRFFRKHEKHPALLAFQPWLAAGGVESEKSTGQSEVALPGFGQLYGGVNELANAVARKLAGLPAAGSALKWGCDLTDWLLPHHCGWLMPGVAAAVFSDLGFQPRMGVCLFQLLSAPGVLAHGLELANKPITAMPYVSDDNYVIDRE